MRVDNFRLISGLLSFDDSNSFYWVQIIKRRKDNNELTKPQKLIDCFEINSLDDLRDKSEKIRDICLSENARAYITINKRSRKTIALKYLEELARRISNEDYNIRNMYHSILGKYHSDSKKKWIVDVDDVDDVDDIVGKIEELQKEVEGTSGYIGIVPTVNGFHIITTPFNISKFHRDYPDIEIHKDNPTLLFYEEIADARIFV